MYENVKPYGKPRTSMPLFLLLMVCMLIFAIVIGLFAWAWNYQEGYRRFLGDFSNSTYYAYNHDSLTVQMDGQTYAILPENVYPIYAAITSRGSGRLGAPPETEPEAVLTFGDGSYMELWMVELVNSTTDLTYGLFLNYVNQEGERYSYDNDRLEMHLLPIEPGENIPETLK